MNGAQSLVKTLLNNGVDTVFANPGTSEMHFVAALDQHSEMNCVLCLFEGGTTGAADGYYRMRRDVAGTLLHLAPGFGNAFANLHNARKAGSGIVNVVGDHATHHLRYESPLKGDILGISRRSATGHACLRGPLTLQWMVPLRFRQPARETVRLQHSSFQPTRPGNKLTQRRNVCRSEKTFIGRHRATSKPRLFALQRQTLRS